MDPLNEAGAPLLTSLSPEPLGSGEGLFRRLVWLTLLRIVLVTLLMGASAFVVLRADVQDLGRVETVLYGVILATYLASLGYLVVLRRYERLHVPLAFAQIGGDTLISCALVYLTGGAESVLVFMFPLTVVSAAVLLYRRGAIAAAVLCTLGLALVVVGLNNELLPPASPVLEPQVLPTPRLLFFLFGHASAIFLTAALASYLAEQVRQTGARLEVAEHDYKALELLHESIVHSITSGICTADRFGRVTFLNRAGELITGLPQARVRGEPMERHLPWMAKRLHGDGSLVRFEAEHLVEGRPRTLGAAVSPLVDRDGQKRGYLVAFEDLTGIRAMQEAVKRAERLAAVGAMAAGLAHELRNPLASMGGSLQLLGEGKAFSEDEQRLMSIVLREADRLNRLVSDFLQFARPSPPAVARLDLRHIIEETLELFGSEASRKGLEVVRQLDRPLPVRADPGQLRQVLWNLLNNAAESMTAGGRITVTGEALAGTIRVQIADTGSGIEGGDLPHIFEPFYTTKQGGTGLGLATVYAIVEAHGGRIEVKSEKGQGTTFTVALPHGEESFAAAS